MTYVNTGPSEIYGKLYDIRYRTTPSGDNEVYHPRFAFHYYHYGPSNTRFYNSASGDMIAVAAFIIKTMRLPLITDSSHD